MRCSNDDELGLSRRHHVCRIIEHLETVLRSEGLCAVSFPTADRNDLRRCCRRHGPCEQTGNFAVADESAGDIFEMLILRDVEAFVRGDWEAVSSDFDQDHFVGFDGADPGGWRLAFPTLSDYRRSWLEQARSFAGIGEDAERQLLAAQHLAELQIDGSQALARKVFDGSIETATGDQALSWETYYFLHQIAGVWKIRGFVGYLPADASSDRDGLKPAILGHGAGQHSTAGPYRPVLSVTKGRLVVLSGQGPLNDQGEVVGATIEDQTATTIRNCEAQLSAAAASLDDVFKVNVYLADLDDWSRFNETYRRLMPRALPVRTTVGVDLLLGMRVEIDMWAAVEGDL